MHTVVYIHLCDSFLHRASGNKPIDHDFVLLSDTMRPAKSLDVIVRIPIRVVDDDGVCRGQIDTQTTGTRGQEEHKLFGSRSCVWRSAMRRVIDDTINIGWEIRLLDVIKQNESKFNTIYSYRQ